MYKINIEHALEGINDDNYNRKSFLEDKISLIKICTDNKSLLNKGIILFGLVTETMYIIDSISLGNNYITIWVK